MTRSRILWMVLLGAAVLLAALIVLVRNSDKTAGESDPSWSNEDGKNGATSMDALRVAKGSRVTEQGRTLVEIDERASGAASGSIRVVAIFEGNGEAAANIPIQFYPLQGIRSGKIHKETDADGTVVMSHLSPGRWAVDCLVGPFTFGIVRANAETTIEVVIPRGRELIGTVVDGDHQPIPAAGVWLSKFANRVTETASATTDHKGRFHIESVGRAATFGATAAGFAPSPPMLLAGQAGPVEILLVRNGASVSGTISDDSGIPLSGALVQLASPSSAEEGVGQVRITDGEGRFLFLSVHVGTSLLRAVSPGHVLAEHQLYVADGGSVVIDVVLQKGGTIGGIVRSPDGRCLPDVRVYYGDQKDPLYNWCLSGDDGSYVLEGVASGEVALIADGNEKGKDTTSLYCQGQCKLIWDPIVGSGPGIAGVVLDADGQGVAGLRIVATRGSSVFSTKSDHDGAFSIQDCPAGQYRVEARDPSNLCVAFVEGAEPGTYWRLAVRDRTARIVGTIYGDGNRPVAEAKVVFSPNDRSAAYPPSTTGIDGSFVGPALWPGSYSVLVDHPAYLLNRTEVPGILDGETRDLGRVELQASGSIQIELSTAGPGDFSACIYDTDGSLLAIKHVVLGPSGQSVLVRRLPLSRVRVVILSNGEVRKEEWTTLAAGTPNRLAITLD